MALAEVIELEPVAVEVERVPGKCPDCFGTGGVTDEDGSFTGVVGQPMACSCMGFFRCLVLAHAAGCRCREREIEQWCTVPAVAPSFVGGRRTGGASDSRARHRGGAGVQRSRPDRGTQC